MELPIQFIYTENGVEKTSVDENKRMNYIDDLNRRLLDRKGNGRQRTTKIEDDRSSKHCKWRFQKEDGWMIEVTGNVMKSEIANAIQKYNGAEIYSYGDFLPPFTECFHVNSNDATIQEFCKYILKDLIKKTKTGSIPMIVIYTNESDLKSVGILEDYSISNYEHDGYVNTVVLMTRWKIAFLLKAN